MRVGILYNEPRPGSEASDQDVLVQRDAVSTALRARGYETISIGCTLDLSSVRRALAAAQIDCAFNLVESLGGTDRLQPLVPLLLDAMDIPYTGSSAAAMLATTDKVAVKRRLRALRLPTPDWVNAESKERVVASGKFIVKARFEHASVGLDDSSVMSVKNANELRTAIRARSATTGLRLFAERFVEGREFNIAVLAAGSGQPQVLSPAEIDFSSFPPAKPKIVGYDAKWAEHSFEFNATPRRFSFPVSDDDLLHKLATLARAAWSAFGLSGYARVDFRVDSEGNPLILEINTNPCLSPDAGFAAALAESGYTFDTAVELIVKDALRAASQ